MSNFVTRIVSQTGPKKPHSGSISFFFQTFDLIYSLIEKAATVLPLLAKYVGVVHQSFDMGVDL